MSATGVEVEVTVDPVTDVARPGLAGNALGMLAGRMASMALGFLFWLGAAHAADATEVGLTSAVVASMMLCTQLAQLGIGAAFIAAYPEEQRRPAELLDTAVSLSALGALLCGGLFLLVARIWFDELGTVAGCSSSWHASGSTSSAQWPAGRAGSCSSSPWQCWVRRTSSSTTSPWHSGAGTRC
jgi:hypothetical protein